MTTYVALLRAVNVGGTGKLPMAELKSLCNQLGWQGVETYIASGNVVFDCKNPADAVRLALARRLAAHAGKAVGVFVRTAAEMQEVLHANPFTDRDPKRTYGFFLDAAPPRDALRDVRGQHGEELAVGRREIYVFYPDGMGRSKLVIPVARSGTARNLRTIAKLVELCARRA